MSENVTLSEIATEVVWVVGMTVVATATIFCAKKLYTGVRNLKLRPSTA